MKKCIRKTVRLANMKIGLICRDDLWGIEYFDAPGSKAKQPGQVVHRPFALSTAGFQTRHSEIETIHQLRCIGYEPGYSMASLEEPKITPNRKIELAYLDEASGLAVTVAYKAATKGAVLHATVTVTNTGTQPVSIEHISPVFPGLSAVSDQAWAQHMHIHFARNAWNSEAQWYDRLICEEGMNVQHISDHVSTFFSLQSTGGFSTSRYLPLAVLEDRAAGKCYFWEIRYSGSWYMEVGIQGQCFYALPSGPTKAHNHFWKTLAPGESLSCVPVSFGVAVGGFNKAVAELTKYRRADLRPKCVANDKLPVIFDDYMHCLGGDATEEKELPLIEAAARAGAEYYVMDAGWYAGRDERWWSAVGEWRESPDRFPRGLDFITDRIRQRGMIPGLWLEIEVMGVDCPLVKDLPDDWFFYRGGKRVIAANRYFLDFANPAVREHCHSVVDRLVAAYDLGYLKIDYNVNSREGNEAGHESPGAGQTAHVEGVYQWLDEVCTRHPKLIIESVSSGGGRLEYGMLAHVHLQSTTDQTDYFRMPSITSGTLAAGLPEQMLQWSYPRQESDPENVVFCIMLAMLSRFDLSGQLHKLDKRRMRLVEKGIAIYKSYRKDIPKMIPFYPRGTTLIHEDKGFVVVGLKRESNSLAYVAVFRLDDKAKTVKIALDGFEMKRMRAAVLYPAKMPGKVEKTAKGIKVTLPSKRTARLIRLSRK